MPLTYDVADLAVHLVKLGLHLPADHAIRVARVVNAQVVAYQHVPGGRPCQQWQQMLQRKRRRKQGSGEFQHSIKAGTSAHAW
jgi:hypothetical protein